MSRIVSIGLAAGLFSSLLASRTLPAVTVALDDTVDVPPPPKEPLLFRCPATRHDATTATDTMVVPRILSNREEHRSRRPFYSGFKKWRGR